MAGTIPRLVRITRDVERWKGRRLTLRAQFSDCKPRLVYGSPADGWRVFNGYKDKLRPRLYAADREALSLEWWRLRRKACADLF
jgi:hypothetical protein